VACTWQAQLFSRGYRLANQFKSLLSVTSGFHALLKSRLAGVPHAVPLVILITSLSDPRRCNEVLFLSESLLRI
jgi:hypothetical protein